MRFIFTLTLLAATAHAADVSPAGTVGIEALQTYAETLQGEHHEAAGFLLKHLPMCDRDSLSLDLFRENLEQAFVARQTHPWTRALPRELFFNDVLPHAVVTETRDAWRKTLREILVPELNDAATLKQAAHTVGANLRRLTGVEYSTRREKACQSPAESMRQGVASCTGLSILMVDALRAIGIPARLATIPMWGTGEGNHTWVEIHDGKDWRFTGYGATPDQWDEGWEITRCAYCDPTEPMHGVFASSYRRTGVGFPTIWEWPRSADPYCEQERDTSGSLTRLVWKFQKEATPGVDRTAHYLAMAGGRRLAVPKGEACVSVRLVLKGTNTRIDLPVCLRRGDQILFDGRSASEALDLNDSIRMPCPPGPLIIEHQTADGRWHARKIDAAADQQTEVNIEVTEVEATGFFSITQRKALAAWFRSGGAAWPTELEGCEMANSGDVTRAKAELWSIFRDAHRLYLASRELGPLPAKLEDAARWEECPAGSLTLDEQQMPFMLVRRESQPVPAGGRALYIALHGGGRNDTAKGPHAWPVNTAEWHAQAKLAAGTYAGEGIYFVPRMADDRIGRWHLAFNQDAFDKVIEHALREWGVDPDRVYLMGISEGCYGTQILAPQMTDRFAAACAMAGGISEDMPLENLRNVAFRTEVGENDTMFDRIGLARRYHTALDEYSKEWGPYNHVLHVQPGRGHGIDYGIGPRWMIQYQRNSRPPTIVWTSMPHDGRRRSAFYWLGLDGNGLVGRVHLAARFEAGVVKLKILNDANGSFGNAKVRVMLDDTMLDLDQPVRLEVNEKVTEHPAPGRRVETLALTLAERGDPKLIFPAVIEVAP